MAASASLVSNHRVGIGDLPQSPAFVACLATARLEGGLELFELSKFNRRRRSATSARSAVISALSEAIKSATSAGISIPPLIQIRRSLSAKTR